MPAQLPENRPPRLPGDPSGLSGVERGNRIHQLLQVAAELGAMPPGSGDIHAEAAAVFNNPDLDWVFRPTEGRGLCEVPVIHRRKAPAGPEAERHRGIEMAAGRRGIRCPAVANALQGFYSRLLELLDVACRDPATGLENQDLQTSLRQLLRSPSTGRSGAYNDYIVFSSHTSPDQEILNHPGFPGDCFV